MDTEEVIHREVEHILKTYGSKKEIARLIKRCRAHFLSGLKKPIVETIVDGLECLYEEDFSNRYAIIHNGHFPHYVKEKLDIDCVEDSQEYYKWHLSDAKLDSYRNALSVANDTWYKLREIYNGFKSTFDAYVFRLLTEFKAQLIVNKEAQFIVTKCATKESVYVFDVVGAEDSSGQRIDWILFRIKDGYREMVDLLIQCFKRFAYDKLDEYYKKDGLK